MLRYYNPMKMADILSRIDQRRAELKLADRAISLKANGSTDLIRNWRRALAEGKTNSSANHANLDRVAQALGVSLEWLLSGDQAEEEKEIRRLVSRLSAPLRHRLLTYAEGLLAAQETQQTALEGDE
jgi:transcriptional regulator with XRE-family HTH domain